MAARAEQTPRRGIVESLIKSSTVHKVVAFGAIVGVSATGAKVVNAEYSNEYPGAPISNPSLEFNVQNPQSQYEQLGLQNVGSDVTDLNEIARNAPVNKLVSQTQEPVSAPQTVEILGDSLSIHVEKGSSVNQAVINALEEKTGVDLKDRAERNAHKVNICHRTGSDRHPFEAINVDRHAFDGEGKNDHTKHGDFLYAGPIDKNGHPTKEGDQWCEGRVATPNPNPNPTEFPKPIATPTPVIGEPISLPPTGGEPVSTADRLGTMLLGAMAMVVSAAGFGVWKANDIFIRRRQLATKGISSNDYEGNKDFYADELGITKP